LNPNIFRQYSIRGVADQDLSEKVVTYIGAAIGTFFRRRGGQALVVGRDVRNSSPRISRSLVAGLLRTGIQVTDVGMVPTPVHNFATDAYGADGGVMVTAMWAFYGRQPASRGRAQGPMLQTRPQI